MASKVKRIQLVNRTEKFDQDGGGLIQRTIYVEPYSSHPTVLAGLRGTVRDANRAGSWERVLPHSDPLFPWFYCADCSVVPMDPRSVRAMRSAAFDTTNLDEIAAVQDALDTFDDYDGQNMIDNLEPNEISDGGVRTDDTEDGWESRGDCGAYIVASYNPLITCAHETDNEYGGDKSGFDYLNPTWTPVQKVAQLGRDMKFIAPIDKDVPLIGGTMGYCGGVSDTAAMVETIWELRITRRLVPFLPKITFGVLQAKINTADFIINDNKTGTKITLPPGTVRFDQALPKMGITPDGQTYWDIELVFSVRMMWADFYEMGVMADDHTVPPMTLVSNWLHWNVAYGIPALPIIGLPSNTPGFYPVGWKTEYPWTSAVEKFRFLHLTDEDVPQPPAPVSNGPAPGHVAGLMSLGVDLFNNGFTSGQ